jgi:hypothetical protein
MRGRQSRALGALVRVTCVLGLGATPAFAEGAGAAARSRAELLARAERERAAGHDAEALAAALAAAKLGVTSSLLRFVAEERAALGEFGAAYEAARGCTEAAANEPPSANHDVVFLGCRALMHELEPRVGLLSFAWSGDLPESAVLVLDGEVIAPERRARGLEPGEHELHFDAVGYEPIALELSLKAGETRQVELTLVPAEPAPQAREPGAPPQAPVAASPPAGARPAHVAKRSRPALTPPILVAGGGAALLALALATNLDSSAKYADLRRSCERAPCGSSPPERRAIDGLDTATTVLLLAGSAAVATGAVWLTLNLSARGRRSAEVGVGPGFCSVRGAF